MKKLLKNKFLFLFACLLLPAKLFAVSFENDEVLLNIETKTSEKTVKILASFALKDGWHISWQNPGDAGVPTQFYVNGRQVLPVALSVPQKFLYEDILVQYGFEHKAYYLLEVPKSDEIKLRVKWGVCQDYCEPQAAEFDLKTQDTPSFENSMQQAQTTFPTKVLKKAKLTVQKEKLTIDVKDFKDPLYFIASRGGLFSPLADQKVVDGKKLEIDATDLKGVPEGGLLITKNGAYEIWFSSCQKSLLWLLILAFIGGVILNLMPCVFPILSLKALNAAQNAHLETGRFLRGTAYISGVVSSFLLIAGLLFVLKTTGALLGWGFQLQSSVFVFVMIVFFSFVLLYLFDVLKVKIPFLSAMNKASTMNSFWTGFFAVLIASPCTGPFMGAAIGYALFESAYIYFPMFLSLSLGYALPFALLEFFPSLMKKIMPKPGIWMVRLKYILSIPIVLTILWLSWIFYHQISVRNTQDVWENYSAQAFYEAIENGDAVFVDFTAKWCLTCLLNEKTVLYSEEFIKTAKENEVRLFKADWTNQSDDIFFALKTYGRSSVPLYVYYPQSSQNYVILPQILTKDFVLEVIDGE